MLGKLCHGSSRVTQGKLRQDREGWSWMDHFSGTTCGVIHSRIWLTHDWDQAKQAGAGPDRGEEESGNKQTIWLLNFMSTPLFLLSFFGYSPACAAHFVHFMPSGLTEMLPGRRKTKENPQLVLKTTTHCHCPHSVFPPLNSVFT